MLTIKSNFLSFKDRQNELYTSEDLTKLYQNLVAVDMINFRGNIGRGFTDAITKQIITKISVDKDAKIVIINDLSFHMYNALTDAGFKSENIYLAFGKWSKKAEPDEDIYAYDLLKLIAKSSFREELNIITLKEMLNMKHFDLVIANPPYGSIGSAITQSILDNIDFGEFVNLLPATNYRLSKTDLQKHVDPSKMIVICNAFEDAAVLPTISRVYKEEINDLTPMGFRIETQTDPTTKKYFWANVKRDATYTDMLETQRFAKDEDQSFSRIIFLPMRLASGTHGHGDLASLSRGIKGLPYRVAMGLVSHQSEVGKDSPQCGTYVRFSTKEEKKNCGEFLFGDGFRFVLWLLNSMRVDVAHKAEHEFWLPRVDWHKKWTPREILEDYGYSEEEIAQVEEKMTEYPDLKE